MDFKNFGVKRSVSSTQTQRRQRTGNLKPVKPVYRRIKEKSEKKSARKKIPLVESNDFRR